MVVSISFGSNHSDYYFPHPRSSSSSHSPSRGCIPKQVMIAKWQHVSSDSSPQCPDWYHHQLSYARSSSYDWRRQRPPAPSFPTIPTWNNKYGCCCCCCCCDSGMMTIRYYQWYRRSNQWWSVDIDTAAISVAVSLFGHVVP